MGKRIWILGLVAMWALVLGLIGVLGLYEKGEDSHLREGFSAQAVLLYDRDQGRTVFSFGDQEKLAPASLVKLMTCLVVLDHQADLGAPAPILPDAKAMASERGASQTDLGPGDETSYRDLLYATMLASDGAAAQSLAIHVAGSEEAFVKLMNRRAFRMGLFRTHFTNPVGFDHPDQVTTARDMARLLDKALRDPDFYALFTSPSYTVGATSAHPFGLTISSTVIGPAQAAAPSTLQILGGKSGTTHAAGQSWASLGKIGATNYLCIVLGAPYGSGGQISDSIRAYGMAAAFTEG